MMSKHEMTQIVKRARSKKLKPALIKGTDVLCFSRSSHHGKLEPLKWKDFFSHLEKKNLTVVDNNGYLEIRRGPGYRKKPRNKFRQLKTLSRRRACAQFVTWNTDLLTGKRFSYDTAARVLRCRRRDIYYLIRWKFRLFTLVAPLRRALGLPVERGEAVGEPHAFLVETGPLHALATPTGVLGTLARMETRFDEHEMRKALRFLERALADPVVYQYNLLNLVQRASGQPVTPIPADARERARSTLGTVDHSARDQRQAGDAEEEFWDASDYEDMEFEFDDYEETYELPTSSQYLQPDPSQTRPSAQEPAGEPGVCPNCFSKIKPDYVICPYCGERL